MSARLQLPVMTCYALATTKSVLSYASSEYASTTYNVFSPYVRVAHSPLLSAVVFKVVFNDGNDAGQAQSADEDDKDAADVAEAQGGGPAVLDLLAPAAALALLPPTSLEDVKLAPLL